MGRRTRPSSGLGGHVFMRKNSQDAIREFRPYFDHAPVYGGAMSLEDYMAQTPMTIGSPQQVIDRTLGFREFVGDYQRQLFIADHAGLPLKTVLEQMDILGSEVVPVLRREFEALRPADVPAGPPLHPRVVAAQAAAADVRRRRPRPWRRRPHERAGGPVARRRDRRACPSHRRAGCWATGWPPPSSATSARPGSSRASRSSSCATTPSTSRIRLLTGFPSPSLQAALDAVLAADGVIAVSPIFSGSYSGLFKLFFDAIDRDGFRAKPVLIAATGGTPRHSLAIEHAIRPLFAYLRAAVVPTGVYAATEDWGQGAVAADGSLVERIERAATELAAAMARRGHRRRATTLRRPGAVRGSAPELNGVTSRGGGNVRADRNPLDEPRRTTVWLYQ